MRSIIEIVADNARLHPERLIVVDDLGEHTYGDTWQQVLRTATGLNRMGIAQGQSVLVQCTQDYRYLVCGLALQLINAYFTPFEKEAAQGRVQEICAETDAALAIVLKPYELATRQISFEEAMACDRCMEWPMPALDTTAEILYTTGTTGKSKGIAISHRNNVAIAENIAYGTEMPEGNVELIPLPLSHSHGLRCTYANLLRNGTVILTDGVTKVGYIYQLLKKYKATAMDLSPTAASVLLKLTRGKFAEFNDQLAYIQIGTAALPEETKEELLRQFPDVRLYNFYGSTESGRSCVLNFNSPDNRKYCIGFPTRNATFIITDDDRNPIASDKDHTGLLACTGPMNMQGYWKQPELTKEIMRDGYIFTNDEGYIDEEGRVYVLGRKDDIINYRGIKIAPEEIEEVARRHEAVADCACIPQPDKLAGQVPKLLLVCKEGVPFDKTAFVRFIESGIDGNKMPKFIELIPEIPRASNGKIQRKKLVAQYQ